ncbi:MAG TPA: heme ABC transporter ATP-binding protein [Thermoanaerobaculia bacterium]|nr:heme ABC transporter ATP-binding protein [Thermoanaerobaculia bacterium]
MYSKGIEARGVVYAAGGHPILHGVSARFEPGRLHLILGPNGAGKSTFVKVLSRLLRPQKGQVLYGGEDVAHQSEQTLAERRAVLSQAIEIAFPLWVHEVVMMGRYPHFSGRPGHQDRDVVAEVMRYCDVTDLAERSYPTLSGGEKQRVNFARVLAQVWQPRSEGGRYLFLDEPLTFLDIGHQIDLMRKLRDFGAAPDITVVGVVHDLALAARFADQLVLIHEGAVLAAGPPGEVMTPEHVRAAFGVEPVSVATPDGRQHLVFD